MKKINPQDNPELALQEASSRLGNPVTHFTIKHGSNGTIKQATKEAAVIMSDLATLKASGEKQLYAEDGTVILEKLDI